MTITNEGGSRFPLDIVYMSADHLAISVNNQKRLYLLLCIEGLQLNSQATVCLSFLIAKNEWLKFGNISVGLRMKYVFHFYLNAYSTCQRKVAE